MIYILLGIDEPNKDDCAIITVTEPLKLDNNGVAIVSDCRYVESIVRFQGLKFILDAASEASRLPLRSSEIVPPLPQGADTTNLNEQLRLHAAERQAAPMSPQKTPEDDQHGNLSHRTSKWSVIASDDSAQNACGKRARDITLDKERSERLLINRQP